MERRNFIKFTLATAGQAMAGAGLVSFASAIHASPDLQNAIKNAQILTNWEANPGRNADLNYVEGLRDGVVGGYGGTPGDKKHEWETRRMRSTRDAQGKVVSSNATVHLIWYQAIPVNSVHLYDRPNKNDQVLSGYILTDDNTRFAFGALNNEAKEATVVKLGDKWTRTLTIVLDETSTTTEHIGLAEVIVNSADAGTHPKKELPELNLSIPGLASSAPTNASAVLHNKAWQYAMEHISYNTKMPQARFMDEACWNNGVWPWDTMFMSMYCKYAPKMMPGVESLENFYRVLHDGERADGVQFIWLDNPPLYAWAEYNNALYTGDATKRTDKLIRSNKWLIKEYERRATAKNGDLPVGARRDNQPETAATKFVVGAANTWEVNSAQDGVRWFHGHASGMDNTPRERQSKKVYWVDALAQHGMQALYIAKFFEKNKDSANAKVWRDKFTVSKNAVQKSYWDPSRKLFMDRYVSNGKLGAFSDVETVASFWPMQAEMATQDQAADMLAAIQDPKRFGGEIPFVTLSRSDRDYAGAANNPTANPNDGRCDYWRGGVWLPTSYMGVQGLMKYGYMAEAKDATRKTMQRIINTYYNPAFPRQAGVAGGTIWECYSPEGDKPSTEHGRTARRDFCGWSALGPISMQIESYLGLYRVDGFNRTVYWWWDGERNMRVANLSLMGDTVASFEVDANGMVSVLTNKAFTLVMNGFVQEIQPNATTYITVEPDNGSNNFAEASVTLDTGFDPDATYYIRTATGSAFTVKNDATALNQPVVQQPSADGKQSQKFQLKRDDGLFQIIPKGITANAAMTLRGNVGDLWFSGDAAASDSKAQKFTIVGNPKDGYLIRCVGRNEVVTSLKGNALRPELYNPAKASTQRWFITKA